MRYYADYDKSGRLTGFGAGTGGTEITEAEYNRLKAEIAEIAAWVDRVYADPAQAEQVPAEWRENVLQQVEQRKQWEAEAQNTDISPEELGAMLMEVL